MQKLNYKLTQITHRLSQDIRDLKATKESRADRLFMLELIDIYKNNYNKTNMQELSQKIEKLCESYGA